MTARARTGRPTTIRLPLLGEVVWPVFYAGILILPPLFVIAVWLFFSNVHVPHAPATRALFVTAVSVVLSISFSTFLLGAVGRAYVRLGQASRTVRRQNLQLRALHQASLVLNEDLDLPTVLARIVSLSRHVLDVASARLEPAADLPDDAPAAPDDRSQLRIPMRFHGQLLATLYLSRPGRPFAPEEVKTAERFATRAGAAIANARLLEEVRRLGGADERERIARELHDGTVQALYGLSLELQAALLAPDHSREDLETALRMGVDRIAQMVRDLREYVTDSTHAVADHSDLQSVLRAELEPLIRPGGPRVEWQWRPDRPLAVPVSVARELAHVVGESVRNAMRHGDPHRITISADLRASGLTVEVRDDGRGFAVDPSGASGGHGMRDMVRRMRGVGGTLSVDSRPGQGTRVRAHMPWLTPQAPTNFEPHASS